MQFIGIALFGMLMGVGAMQALPERYGRYKLFIAIAAILILVAGLSGTGLVIPTHPEAYAGVYDAGGLTRVLGPPFLLVSAAMGVLIACMNREPIRLAISTFIASFTLLPMYTSAALASTGAALFYG